MVNGSQRLNMAPDSSSSSVASSRSLEQFVTSPDVMRAYSVPTEHPFLDARLCTADRTVDNIGDLLCGFRAFAPAILTWSTTLVASAGSSLLQATS